MQDQANDHVLKKDKRRDVEFRNACDYIAHTPERAELVGDKEFALYGFSGCVVPGYPELRPFDAEFWDRFDKGLLEQLLSDSMSS